MKRNLAIVSTLIACAIANAQAVPIGPETVTNWTIAGVVLLGIILYTLYRFIFNPNNG